MITVLSKIGLAAPLIGRLSRGYLFPVGSIGSNRILPVALKRTDIRDHGLGVLVPVKQVVRIVFPLDLDQPIVMWLDPDNDKKHQLGKGLLPCRSPQFTRRGVYVFMAGDDQDRIRDIYKGNFPANNRREFRTAIVERPCLGRNAVVTPQ
jgi:hypothetical protein